MRLFSNLYVTVMRWAVHPRANWYLGLLSAAESSFFPIPPDTILVPMCLARPAQAWRLAALTTVTSVIGGILGYLIGAFVIQAVAGLFATGGYYADQFNQVQQWFANYGVWAIFIAGFSPIPYKVFTIASGVLMMPLIPFIIASALGRGARFFLVAALIVWGGAAMERVIRQSIDWLGWGIVVLVLLFLAFKIGLMII
jgi:membrane protein YqaA with SNARE-associated domain